ncbi:ABC transporter ATP-binding protein [Arthrobacter castelli]|uniref:ABC transporter ATP-binding protein n=1 Tax=Arthrobacter castelli TaxID=271431 RepID=UPI000413680A|nr:ABC transporter ATP-binding protein [Arthrobacter castelli]
MPVLELDNVTAAYGKAEVLHGIGLKVEPGGAVGILGANGAGKTTTLRAVSGMVKTGGQVTFNGRKITGLRPDQVAGLGISHVPQGRGTLARLSVRDNLLVGAYRRKDSRGVAVDLEHYFELFPQLAARRNNLAAALSGGEQQLLAIGRAFMSKPELMLLDEPSLGLAPSTAQGVYEAIAELRRHSGLSMVVVEQNAALAFSIVEEAIVLETGHVALAGTRDELMGMDAIREAYLGG